MAGRLSSPRFRRRALKLSGLAAVAGAAALISILFWNTGHSYDSPVRPNEPAVVPPVSHSVSLSEKERRQVLDIAAHFVRTAVRREHTAESFDLVSEQLRSGFTKQEWAKGNIPVQPYPVDAARWKMDYTYEEEVGLSVYVIPRRGERLSPMVFLLSNLSIQAANPGAPDANGRESRLAAAIELLHEASLVHDDIVHRSPTREVEANEIRSRQNGADRFGSLRGLTGLRNLLVRLLTREGGIAICLFLDGFGLTLRGIRPGAGIVQLGLNPNEAENQQRRCDSAGHGPQSAAGPRGLSARY